ncbi:MAG: hypothetical protein KC621_29310, partial [Myxococcales bacterium]|nr:hypothetical protein [Myxococcales bacterium]
LLDMLDEPMPMPVAAAPIPRPAPASPQPAPRPQAPQASAESIEFANPFAGSADRFAADQAAAAAAADASKPWVSDGPVRTPNVSTPKPKPCLDPMASGDPDVGLEGVGLAASAVSNALRPFLPKVGSCLPSGSRGMFEVTASFQVGCDGRVTGLTIEDTGGLPQRVVDCIQGALWKAPFPSHDRQGGEVVELPLRFTGDALDF